MYTRAYVRNLCAYDQLPCNGDCVTEEATPTKALCGQCTVGCSSWESGGDEPLIRHIGRVAQVLCIVKYHRNQAPSAQSPPAEGIPQREAQLQYSYATRAPLHTKHGCVLCAATAPLEKRRTMNGTRSINLRRHCTNRRLSAHYHKARERMPPEDKQTDSTNARARAFD